LLFPLTYGFSMSSKNTELRLGRPYQCSILNTFQMKKLSYFMLTLLVSAFVFSCTPESQISQLNEQACCGDDGTLPPPPPPPPPPPEGGD